MEISIIKILVCMVQVCAILTITRILISSMTYIAENEPPFLKQMLKFLVAVGTIALTGAIMKRYGISFMNAAVTDVVIFVILLCILGVISFAISRDEKRTE